MTNYKIIIFACVALVVGVISMVWYRSDAINTEVAENGKDYCGDVGYVSIRKPRGGPFLILCKDHTVRWVTK